VRTAKEGIEQDTPRQAQQNRKSLFVRFVEQAPQGLEPEVTEFRGSGRKDNWESRRGVLSVGILRLRRRSLRDGNFAQEDKPALTASYSDRELELTSDS
jgi:hypothetical protein